MTQIDIISGFLGAGKTTLIKKLLTEAFQGEKVVLIENEFGEIGIDGGFLKDAGVQVTEMNSGCICCSLVGDFAPPSSRCSPTTPPPASSSSPPAWASSPTLSPPWSGCRRKLPSCTCTALSPWWTPARPGSI